MVGGGASFLGAEVWLVYVAMVFVKRNWKKEVCERRYVHLIHFNSVVVSTHNTHSIRALQKTPKNCACPNLPVNTFSVNCYRDP